MTLSSILHFRPTRPVAPTVVEGFVHETWRDDRLVLENGDVRTRVVITSRTIFNWRGGRVAAGDLQYGDWVRVEGIETDPGVITATSIRLLEKRSDRYGNRRVSPPPAPATPTAPAAPSEALSTNRSFVDGFVRRIDMRLETFTMLTMGGRMLTVDTMKAGDRNFDLSKLPKGAKVRVTGTYSSRNILEAQTIEVNPAGPLQEEIAPEEQWRRQSRPEQRKREAARDEDEDDDEDDEDEDEDEDED